MNTEELLEEARGWSSSYASWGDNGLVDRLADALEAATRVPVQGEPNHDRERIAAILQLRHPGNMYSTCERDADAILAAGFSRATAPDTASAAIERIREAVSGHPECDRYSEGDVISCGWKSAYASVLAALAGKEKNDEKL